MFSVSLSLTGTQSYIFFGGYEPSKIPTVTWTNLNNTNFFWELTMAEVYVNQTVIVSSREGTAIIDTGSSLAMFPVNYF